MGSLTAAILLAPLAIDPTPRWRPSVEVDPTIAIYWALGSLWYSIHALVKSDGGQWRFGVDTYGGDVPSQYLTGDSRGWTVRETAWGAQTQWFPWARVRGLFRGLFVGSFAIAHRWQYRIGDAETRTWRLGLMPEVGYRWLPFGDEGLYVTPWVGAILDVRIAGSPTISSGRTYPESGVQPIVTLHVGYEF